MRFYHAAQTTLMNLKRKELGFDDLNWRELPEDHEARQELDAAHGAVGAQDSPLWWCGRADVLDEGT